MTDVYGPLPPGMSRATDSLAESYENQAVSLYELIRARLAIRETVIRGVTFTNCRIEGPAVMLVVGGCRFEGVDFGNPNGDIRNLVLRPESPTAVIGAIAVQDCAFRGGHLIGVGYTGGASFLDQILALGTPRQ